MKSLFVILVISCIYGPKKLSSPYVGQSCFIIPQLYGLFSASTPSKLFYTVNKIYHKWILTTINQTIFYYVKLLERCIIFHTIPDHWFIENPCNILSCSSGAIRIIKSYSSEQMFYCIFPSYDVSFHFMFANMFVCVPWGFQTRE